MTSIDRPKLYLAPLLQVIVLLILTGGLWMIDQVLAVSALAGGLVAVIPNLYFTLYAFRYRGARAAQLVVRAFNWGESGKFLLTMTGFGGIFLFIKPISAVTVFLTYVVMILMHLVITAKYVK